MKQNALGSFSINTFGKQDSKILCISDKSPKEVTRSNCILKSEKNFIYRERVKYDLDSK